MNHGLENTKITFMFYKQITVNEGKDSHHVSMNESRTSVSENSSNSFVAVTCYETIFNELNCVDLSYLMISYLLSSSE
jgi:hypothetical protein